MPGETPGLHQHNGDLSRLSSRSTQRTLTWPQSSAGPSSPAPRTPAFCHQHLLSHEQGFSQLRQKRAGPGWGVALAGQTVSSVGCCASVTKDRGGGAGSLPCLGPRLNAWEHSRSLRSLPYAFQEQQSLARQDSLPGETPRRSNHLLGTGLAPEVVISWEPPGKSSSEKKKSHSLAHPAA
ncbi:uncharacterized protein LOC124980486 isoform X2 [Sciurus carolinensis]|uniref:uncharacterized protein LOC124980486 isoform X2 n=1 Tax=Sciurus carolinensis TaxID=30640 RepID=UPI001FB4B2F9|nr:uncharacterized protein LOC124980486 isoform X2 [Sciurus carolinensis]